MSVEIPNGSVATVVAIFSPGSLLSTLGAAVAGVCADPDPFIAAVGQELIFDGLTISGYSTDAGIGAAFGGSWTATLNILNQSGQELDDTDLISQLNDAVNTINSQNSCTIGMNSAGVTAVTGNTSGANGGGGTVRTPVGTAQAQVAPAPAMVHACGDPSWSFWQDPVQWLKCLTQGGLQTVGLLAIGLLVGVVLIVAVKNRPTPV